MNYFGTLMLSFFLGIAIGAEFAWGPVISFLKKENTMRMVHQYLPDGSLHLFWESDTYTFNNNISYQVLFPDGKVISKKPIEVMNKSRDIENVAAQVSNDGKHIVIVYQGRLKTPPYDRNYMPMNFYNNILFVESFNGGESWSEPIMVAGTVRDNFVRDLPSIALEQDTGRVYVGYQKFELTNTPRRYDIVITIREPGSGKFGPEITLPRPARIYYFEFAQTFDRLNLKHYLHVVARTRNRTVEYSRSTDSGKTWSNFSTIANGLIGTERFSMSIDSKAEEGGIYVQSEDKDGLKITWSKNHGDTFGEIIRVGVGGDHDNKMSICGENGKGILVSSHLTFNPDDGYVKFSLLHSRTFMQLPYPFANRFGARNYVTACKYIGNNEYVISILSGSDNLNAARIIRGTLKI